MRIYLNTRSFDKDYQWFNIADDSSISVSKNWWQTKEISNLPLNDEFSVTIGKFENNELFLLATDIQSNRFDNKNREIRNSFLLVSSDEIILRKLATLFLFNNEDLIDKLNFIILDSQETKFGFLADYMQIMFAVESLLDIYEVKFEFDVNVNEKPSYRFGEIFTQHEVKDLNNDILIEYQFNPVFEFKLKRFLLSEIFPENTDIIFSYFSYITLQNIEQAHISLAVGKILDKFAHNMFIKNPEEWATIEIKESYFKKVKNLFLEYKSEVISIGLALTVFTPLVFSYINLSTKNSYFENEAKLLIKKNEVLQIQNHNLLESIQDYNNSTNKYLNSITNLEDELFLSDQKNQEISAEFTELVRMNKIDKENEEEQRHKLSLGYIWYKNKYLKCKKGK